jgi:hypothetical protein
MDVKTILQYGQLVLVLLLIVVLLKDLFSISDCNCGAEKID